MRAGNLRNKVIIQQATEAQDTFGEPDVSWSTFATVWASIEPLRGDEYFTAQQTGASISHRVRMRYLDGVLPKMRILWGERVLEITSVLNVYERNRNMELMCFEVV